jgi:DNA-binding CsgD family transcriptional regulator
MAIVERRGIDINVVRPECVPAHLVTPREMEVVQCLADGYLHREIGQLMGIAVKTVEKHGRDIRLIGMSKYENAMKDEYPHQKRITILSLIQDGIVNGYLTHKPPEEPIIPLSLREDEVLGLVSQGMTYGEIAQNLWLSVKTIQAYMEHIGIKLGTRNYYHTVARATYLKLHGMWPTSK